MTGRRVCFRGRGAGDPCAPKDVQRAGREREFGPEEKGREVQIMGTGRVDNANSAKIQCY